MLKCVHTAGTTEALRFAQQGRFEELVDAGLELLAAHEQGDICQTRLAIDLLPFIVAIDHVELGGLLSEVILEDGADELSGRELVRIAGLFGPVFARIGSGEEADEVVEILTSKRLLSKELRLQIAETKIRRSVASKQVDIVTRSRGWRRSRCWAAAVGYGRALIGGDQGDEGRVVLDTLIHTIERRDADLRRLLEQPDEVGTTDTLPTAMNRWSWARAVLAVGEASDRADERMLHRLEGAGRLFERVGHPLGAAAAYSTLARLRAELLDGQGAVEAAAAALRQTENRVRTVGMPRLAHRWAVVTERARVAGSTFAVGAAAESFDVLDSTHWLGEPATIEARMEESAAIYRTWFVDRQGARLRGAFDALLAGAVPRMIPVGAAGGFAVELVRMRRAALDLAETASVLSLARALIWWAENYRSMGDYQSAIARARSALELFVHVGTQEAVKEGDVFLRKFLHELLTGGLRAAAVCVAAAFADWYGDGGGFDPVDMVVRWARSQGWYEVDEELTAFRLQWIRSAAPESVDLVEALVQWAQLRDRMRPNAGVPVTEHAISLANGLRSEDQVGKLVARVEAMTQRCRQFGRTGWTGEALPMAHGIWAEVQDCDVDLACRPESFARLIDLLIDLHSTDEQPSATATILRVALNRTVIRLEDTVERPLRTIEKVLDWVVDARAIDDEKEVAVLLSRLILLPGLSTDHLVRLRIELAEALMWLDDFESAESQLVTALALDPESVDAYCTLGWIHLTAAAPAKALAAVGKAIKMAPEQLWPRHLRGESLFRLGDHEEALAELTNARQLAPGSEQGALLRAMVLRALHQPELAAQELMEVHAGTSSRDWIRYQYGLSLAAAGSPDEASFMFRDAIDLASTPRRSLNRLRRQGDPNLGLYLLAHGDEDKADAEYRRLVSALPEYVLREVTIDLRELASVIPSTATSTERMEAVVSAELKRKIANRTGA